MLVGVTAGLAAVLLKVIVHQLKLVITTNYGLPYQYVLYLVLPATGIFFATLFVHYILRDKLHRGSAAILHSIARKNSRIPANQTYAHIITSALTVGLGGSAGLESPIVSTGAAIGSNYGDTHKLTYKDRTLLLACGAAAGIGAAFNAPIAGLLFSLEVLLADVTVSAFIPIMIAAASGTLMSKIILNEDILLSFRLHESFSYSHIHWFILLGLLAGFVSVYYSRVFPRVDKYFQRFGSKRKRIIAGGAVLALLIFLFPSLFGEGYSSISALAEAHPEAIIKNSVLENWVSGSWPLLIFIGIILMVKVFATAATLGAGGNGGNFAPSLFVGAYLGYFFSKLINMLGIASVPVANFTIVGMAGILTGIFHAPLTGIFLIAEVTGGYELMIPLMIVSALSYTIVKYFEPYSMDTKRLAMKGRIFTHNKDRNILTKLKVDDFMETNFQPVAAETKFGDLINTISHSNRSVFPVLDPEGNLIGIVHLDNVREIMFKSELYDSVRIKELMKAPPAIISYGDDMHTVMRKFDETGAWNLPVAEGSVYKGFVSKSSVFQKYREILMHQTIGQE